MSKNQRVAVVTGSSTGIGYETSLALANNGYLTYATVRDIQKSTEIERIANVENIPLKIVEMNVDNDKSVKDTIEKITREHGRIDILVNNAGYGLFGALEDLEMNEIKKQFETNVFGVIRVIQNVLPAMRIHNDAMPILRIAVGNDSKKYSRLKKELQDNEFHKVIRGDLLR
jgi:NAD(P)-dependent dehydrogenase (short-subunit alcohol dehydrogenase family)